MALRTRLLRGGLDMLYSSRAHRLLEPVAAGLGVIFTLHRVVAETDRGPAGFAPNSILEISPEFLASAIVRVRERGFETVTLDEARRRIIKGGPGRFAAFTLDDGYRDNLDHAAPVFRRLACPYAIFVASGFVDRRAALWWVGLERAIVAASEIEAEIVGERIACRCDDDGRKQAAFEAVYWPLRRADEAERLAVVAGLCRDHGIDLMAITDELIMDWDDVGRVADDPLATIGAHTVTHATLSRLDDDALRSEMTECRARIAAALGPDPRHFAYPYGDPNSAGPREFAAAAELGFATAVTTRKGVIHPEHAEHLTALPRVSLNGDYQELRYIDLFLSGAPFALASGFRHVNAA